MFRQHYHTLSHLRDPALRLDYLRVVKLRAHPLWLPLCVHTAFPCGCSNCACLQYCDLAEGTTYALVHTCRGDLFGCVRLFAAACKSIFDRSPPRCLHQSPPLHAHHCRAPAGQHHSHPPRPRRRWSPHPLLPRPTLARCAPPTMLPLRTCPAFSLGPSC
jgi:hypothetical protein